MAVHPNYDLNKLRKEDMDFIRMAQVELGKRGFRLEDAFIDPLKPRPIAPFQEWLEETTPHWTWDWRYQIAIQDQIDRVTSGKIDRLMLFLPPRHGKSEMVTVRYPAWRLERDPNTR